MGIGSGTNNVWGCRGSVAKGRCGGPGQLRKRFEKFLERVARDFLARYFAQMGVDFAIPCIE